MWISDIAPVIIQRVKVAEVVAAFGFSYATQMFWHKCIMHASVMLATFHWQISPVLSWRISVFPPLPHSPTPKQFGKRNRFFLRCRITTQSAECRLVVLMCQGVVFFTASTALWKSWYLSMEIFVCFCKQMKMCSLDPHIIQYNHRPWKHWSNETMVE